MREQLDDDLLKLVFKKIKNKKSHVAIVWKGLVDVSVTLEEVILGSQMISYLLKKYVKVKPRFIGISLEPTISFPSILLGILEYGSAFVCMNPEERCNAWNQRICSNLSLGWIFLAGEPNNAIFTLKLLGDSISLVYKKWSIEETMPGLELYASKCAYAVQTSGTTGMPKIVCVPHASIVPNITYLRSIFNVCSNDVVLQAAPSTFDPSVVEIFLALHSGATLIMISSETRCNPVKLAHVLSSKPIPTILQATPSLVRSLGLDRIKNLLLGKCSSLRVLALGGEPCPSMSTLHLWKSHGNKTTIYNIYGTTEASCWSTLHEICYEKPAISENVEAIPIGNPFPHTKLEVRDVKGNILTKGFGELYISSDDKRRMCFVEGSNNKGMRWHATGDLVCHSVKHNHLYFVRRCDDKRTIKRFGQKVSLSTLEAAASQCNLVDACCAVAVSVESHKHLIVLFIVLPQHTESQDQNLLEITKHLRTVLPSIYQPDHILHLPVLPLTSHGKVDSKHLNILAESWASTQYGKAIKRDISQVEMAVKGSWCSMLPQKQGIIQDRESFLACGGDSALAALMAAELQQWAGKTSGSNLLVTILEGTFRDICNQLSKELLDLRNDAIPHGSSSIPNTEELNISSESPAHKIGIGQNFVFKPAEKTDNQVKLDLEIVRGRVILRKSDVQLMCTEIKEGALSIDWSYPMGKCVDASPLVLEYSNGFSLAVVGSHSGRIVGINIESRQEIWIQDLGDRIESSATASMCGKFICLGCYDGRIYCLEAKTGTLCWAFCSGGMIKGSPAFLESAVIFGSYDQCIYCLNLEDGILLWTVNLRAGGILASPCVMGDVVLIATLKGLQTALCTQTGNMKWHVTNAHKKPYFASPIPLDDQHALFGDVDGIICCVSISSGLCKWVYSATGKLFSSVSVHGHGNVGTRIVFGCSDCNLYCLNENGELIWKVLLSGRVTNASLIFPCVCGTQPGLTQWLVAFPIAPRDLAVRCLEKGELIALISLPQETFSSPAVIGQHVFIGCRDNNLYCIKVI